MVANAVMRRDMWDAQLWFKVQTALEAELVGLGVPLPDPF